jgi:hypothetical protein
MGVKIGIHKHGRMGRRRRSSQQSLHRLGETTTNDDGGNVMRNDNPDDTSRHPTSSSSPAQGGLHRSVSSASIGDDTTTTTTMTTTRSSSHCPCCCNDRGFRPCPRTAGTGTSNCCTQYYPLCEVRRHNNAESAWLVAGNDVYDVTEYIHMHPGGRQSILKKAGGTRDCTQDLFFHSKRGKQLWKKYHIGKVRRCYGSACCYTCHQCQSAQSNGRNTTTGDVDNSNNSAISRFLNMLIGG